MKYSSKGKAARLKRREAAFLTCGAVVFVALGGWVVNGNLREWVTMQELDHGVDQGGYSQLDELADISAEFCAGFGELQTLIYSSRYGVDLVEVYSASQDAVYWQVFDVNGDCEIFHDLPNAVWDFDIKVAKSNQ